MDPALFNATIGAPAASPNVLGAQAYGQLANMNAIDRKLPTSGALTNESLNQAQDQIEAQRAAKAAAEHAAALAKQKQEDMSDPKKYRQVKKDDGGYDFFDPEGNQVDIATLTSRTQTKAGDWLSDSENPIDMQYLAESKNLNEYINAKLSRNTKVSDAYEEANPELKKYQGKGGVHQLADAFKKRYERYYVPRSQNANAWGTRPGDNPLVPSRNTSDELDSGIGG